MAARRNGWSAILVALLAALCCGGCSDSGPTTTADVGTRDGASDTVDAASFDGVADAPARDADAGATDSTRDGARADADASSGDAGDAGGADASAATYRTSLQVCWTDPSCRRALLVSHGGDWTLQIPYGSHGAHVRAYQNGADAIKCDLRMSKDGVAIAAHSSPIELWESLDCNGKKIEDMNAADITTKCHMFPSTETFQRVDDVLSWARDKLIVMLTVKESRDFAGGIATVIAAGAEDRVFFEIDTNDFQNTVPQASGWKKVKYLVQINQTSDLDLMLNVVKDPTHAFMYELDPSYSNATKQDVANMITTRILPAGIRPFVASEANPLTATVQNHTDLFNQGFDVIMTYNLANGVVARKQANQARGISPP